MIERQIDTVIFEGAQGSGKTSATEHLASNGYQKVRGIPTGPELIKNSEATNWKQSRLILAEVTQNGNMNALDRSIVSLMAFNMRKKPENADLIYNLGASMIDRTINGRNYCIVVINAVAEECMSREDKKSVVAIESLDEAKREIETYASLADRLRADGFNTVSVDNIGITKEEFLGLINETLTIRE